MVMKKDISAKDLNKAIEESYGEILEDWKKIGILIDKEKFFEKSVSLFAVPFIIENYDLTDDEFRILRFYFRDSFAENTNAVDRIKDILSQRGLSQDLLFGQEVDLTTEQFVFLLKRGIAVKEFIENADWEFLKDVIKNNPDLLDPFAKFPHTSQYTIVESLSKIIDNVDFSKIKANDDFFKEFSNIVVRDIEFKKLFDNEYFLKNFCLVNAGEDVNISSRFLSNKSIKDRFVAKTLLSFIFKSEKQQFLIENGVIVPESIQLQLNADSEYAKNHANTREVRLSNFKDKVAKYGTMGNFTLNDRTNARNYGSDFYEFKKFLTNKEIEEITDGAVLECISPGNIHMHLNKIQDEIFSHASFLSKINIYPLSFNAFSTYIKFFPEGEEVRVFTPDFINKLSSLKERDDYLLFNRYNSLSASKLEGDNLSEYIRRVLKISSAITAKKENLLNVGDLMLSDGLSFVERCLDYKNRVEKRNTPSTPEEYNQKKNEAVNLVMDFIRNNRNLLNIQVSATNENVDHLKKVFSEISGYVTLGTDTDSLDLEYKNDIANEMIKMDMSFDEVYFYDVLGLSRYKIKGVLSEEESKDMLDLIYLEDLSPLKKNKSVGANVLVDEKIKDNQDMMSLLLLTSTYRKRVLAENIFVSAESINNLFDEVSVIDFDPSGEDDYKKILEIEGFVLSYVENNPNQDDLNSIICPNREDGSFERLEKKLNEVKFSPDSLIANYRKNFNKKSIENILSLYSEENPESLNSKNAITLIKAISDEPTKTILHRLITTTNIGLLLNANLSERDLTKLLLDNNQFYKVVTNKEYLKKLEKGLGEIISNCSGVNEDFKKIVGSFRNQEDFPVLISLLKDYAPHTLLSNNLTYIYNTSTTSLITTDDVVMAVKAFAGYAKGCKEILGMTGIDVDFTFEAPKQDWVGKIEDLSGFEKLILMKYGTFAACDGSKFDPDKYSDKDLSFIKGSIKNISPENRAINAMSIQIPEVFTKDFFVLNQDSFSDVYLGFNQEIALTSIRNTPGNISSFLKAGVDVGVNFENSDLWASLIVNSLVSVKLPIIGFLPTFESGEELKSSLLDVFDLRKEKGITNFFSKFYSNDEKINFTLLFAVNQNEILINRINALNFAVAETIKSGTDEEQIRFCRVYTNCQLKKNKSLMRMEEVLFLEDPKINQLVYSIMTKHKISNIFDNLSEVQDSLSDDSSFKI